MALLINGVKVAGLGGNGRDGVGVPTGGAEGQILIKKSTTDYDTQWVDSISVDNTLAVDGAAANAKVVGEAITSLNEAIATKQEKTLVVTIDANKLASHTPAEILAYQTNGAKAVLYTGGVESPFLEGNNQVSVFYSSFVDASKIQFTIYQVNSDRSVTSSRGNYKPSNDADVATKDYVATMISNLINSAPETLDTLGELAIAIQNNEELVEMLNEAIGNKADKSYVNEKLESFNDIVVATDDDNIITEEIPEDANEDYGSKWIEIEILPETVFTDNEEVQDNVYTGYLENFSNMFEEPTYNIYFNGEKYICNLVENGYEIPGDNGDLWGYGNCSLYPYIMHPIDTGEPFFIHNNWDRIHWLESYGNTITLRITKNVEVITQLEGKYVKGTNLIINATPIVEEPDYYTLDKTYKEIKEIYLTQDRNLLIKLPYDENKEIILYLTAVIGNDMDENNEYLSYDFRFTGYYQDEIFEGYLSSYDGFYAVHHRVPQAEVMSPIENEVGEVVSVEKFNKVLKALRYSGIIQS